MGPREDDGKPARRSFLSWLASERRKSKRQSAHWLEAYYWDGGVPVAHEILGISSSGLYLLTDQRWYIGTLVTMTLQSARLDETGVQRSIAVMGKVVRQGEDGVGLAFVLPEYKHSQTEQRHGINVADKKEIESFLLRFSANRRRDGM